MKLSQFKFKLPEEQIAKYPAPHRDESRMMVLHRKSGDLEHLMFKDILSFFDEHDVFVFNDTKVFPARLLGTWSDSPPDSTATRRRRGHASRCSSCAN